MSDSENESYHSDSDQENGFEEESDYSDGEESLDPEQEPTFKPRIKIGSKINADLGGESDEENEEITVHLVGVARDEGVRCGCKKFSDVKVFIKRYGSGVCEH